MWIYRESLQETLEKTGMTSGETLQGMDTPGPERDLVDILSRTTITMVRGESSYQIVADYSDGTSIQLGNFAQKEDAEATLQDLAHQLGAVLLHPGLPRV